MESCRPDWPEGNRQSSHLTGRPPSVRVCGLASPCILNPTTSAERDTGRFDHPVYSISAPHEAVVNAVASRDYAAPSSVLIQLYSDRIGPYSPVVIREELARDHIYTGATSWRRDQMLASVIGYNEGRIVDRPSADDRRPGFPTLAPESEHLCGPLPDLEQIDATTTLTIHAAPEPWV